MASQASREIAQLRRTCRNLAMQKYLLERQLCRETPPGECPRCAYLEQLVREARRDEEARSCSRWLWIRAFCETRRRVLRDSALRSPRAGNPLSLPHLFVASPAWTGTR